MSQAEDLLNSLAEDEVAVASVEPATEPHIVINADKTVTIPDQLKRILVQYEHNIETVTFDCPRYWDGHDLHEMGMKIVFQRADGHKESHPVENLRIDENNTDMIHFDWTISRNTTLVGGEVRITICAKIADAEGVVDREWHTIPNQDLFVNEGMDCSDDEIVEEYPDVIESILVRLEIAEQGGASDEQIANAVSAYLEENPPQAGATAEQAQQIATNKTNIESLDTDKLDKSGWTANKYLGTDENGNVVAKDAPEGTNSDSSENAYELPVATAETLGGVKPVAKTDAMTQEVGVDENGKLFTESGGSGGTDDYTALTNKPSINGVELEGDKTSADLGIGDPTDEQVATAVGNWLDEHPEATTTVADGSITPDKLADADYLWQIFNPEEFLAGAETAMLNTSTGVVSAYTDDRYQVSPYIAADCDTYTVFIPCGTIAPAAYDRMSKVCCYDGDKAFLGSVDYTDSAVDTVAKTITGSFTTVEGTKYIRFSANNINGVNAWREGHIEDIVMCKGTEIYPYYFTGKIAIIDWLSIGDSARDNTVSGDKLKDNTVSGAKLQDGSVSKLKIGTVDPDSIEGVDFVNLFDVEAYQADIASGVDTDKVLRGWLQNNNTLYTASTQYVTILIPCKPNTEYSLYYWKDGVATVWPFDGRIGFRDADGAIFGTYAPETITFTTPAGAYEIICTTPNVGTAYADCQKLMLVYGSETPEYAAHKATPAWLRASKQLGDVSVLCYGDSLTQNMYPAKVASILGVPVTDAGVGGNTCANIHDRVGNYGTDFNVVTLMVGTNDNGGQTSCPLGTADDEAATDDNATASDTTYAARLKRLLNKIKSTHRGATFVIMPPFEHTWSSFEPLAELMGQIAKQYKMPFLDIYHLCGWSGLDTEDKAIFMADNTHENEVGAQRIAELLAGYIKQLKGA